MGDEGIKVPNHDDYQGDEPWHLREQIKQQAERLLTYEMVCRELREEVKFLRATVLNLSERKRK